MLRGEAGQGLTAEVGEFGDLVVGLGSAFGEFADIGLQPGDLGDARVRSLAGLVQLLETVLEVGSQVCVGRLP